MPQLTQNALGKIRQHRNRIDDLIRQNSREDIAATKAGDAAKVATLSANLAALFAEQKRLFDLEISIYPQSGMPRSQAEAVLTRSANDARKIARTASNLTKLLDATARISSLVTRLIAVFT
jgi:hypothetical protein